jgi:F-type H+-transporting ATPase subunit b
MKISHNILATCFLLLIGAVCFATEGHAGASHGEGLDEETIKIIIYQSINVGAIVIGLIYFLRKPLANHFAEKKQTYLASAEKAIKARKSAEDEHIEIKVRLERLQSTADESISRARAEAADMKNQMIAEAQAVSKRMREEAAAAAALEIEKAKEKLRKDLLNDAFNLADSVVKSRVSEADQIRLQSEFITNIQAAH